jgi:hypothetical protein
MAEISEREIKLQARLAVLEFMAVNAHVLIIQLIQQISAKTAEQAADAIRDANSKMLAFMRQSAFSAPDPAISDLWSAELEARFAHILSAVEETLAENRTDTTSQAGR